MSEESKAYRLYNPISGKIVTSRDVVFDEKEYQNWQGNDEVPVSDTLEWGDSNEESEREEAEEETKADQNEEDEKEIEVGLPLCNTEANAEASPSPCNPVRENSANAEASSSSCNPVRANHVHLQHTQQKLEEAQIVRQITCIVPLQKIHQQEEATGCHSGWKIT